MRRLAGGRHRTSTMRRQGLGLFLAGWFGAGAAAAGALPQNPPLPPIRPADQPSAVPPTLPPLPPPRPSGLGVATAPRRPPPDVQPPPVFRAPPAAAFSPGTPPPAGPVAPTPQDIAAAQQVCATLLGSGKVVARPMAPLTGPGGCGVAAPIELSAIVLSPTARIGFRPPVEINCPLGDALADWVRDDLAPAFAKSGLTLNAITSTSGYACRGRNQVVGAKLSEHGKGNAVDIGGFAATDGRVIGVKDATQQSVLAEVRRSACARFATVLGPGSDGYHELHMHVDLEARRNGSRLCHWDMP